SETGSIEVSGIANATGVTTANAFAVGGVGLAQAGLGADVDISASNAGLIDVGATANASAEEADAVALAGVGVIQAGIGGLTTAITFSTVDVSLTNAEGGSILVGAVANATAGDDTGFGYEADANAVAGAGVVQVAVNIDNGDALATLNNGGVVGVAATANGNAVTNTGDAIATAEAGPVFAQIAFAADEGSALAVVSNAGTMFVSADANVVADDVAVANAQAEGAAQFAIALDDNDHQAYAGFDNSGSFNVNASA